MGDIVQQIVENGLPIAAGVLGFFRPLDASKLIGAVLVAGGASGYLYPIATAKVFGVPFADATSSLFFPGIGGRNAAAGLTTLMLSFMGHNEGYAKALGVFLGCWTLAGFSDTGILLATPGSEKALEHMRNVAVLTVVSWRLLTREARQGKRE